MWRQGPPGMEVTSLLLIYVLPGSETAERVRVSVSRFILNSLHRSLSSTRFLDDGDDRCLR
jgi:hypothetical protein